MERVYQGALTFITTPSLEEFVLYAGKLRRKHRDDGIVTLYLNFAILGDVRKDEIDRRFDDFGYFRIDGKQYSLTPDYF